MSSTYTSKIRLEKQADGENANAWGLVLNQNVIDMVDEAVAGMVSIVCTGTITLTTNNGATDQARNAAIRLIGTMTGDTTIVFPAVQKTYFIQNATAGDYNVLLRAGSGAIVTATGQGQSMMMATNGSTINMMKAEDNDTKIYSAFTSPARLVASGKVSATEAKSIYQRVNTSAGDIAVEVTVGNLTLGQYVIVDKVTTTNKMTITWGTGSQGLSLSSATDLAIGINNGAGFSFTETIKA
jgi:hypothetical protein